MYTYIFPPDKTAVEHEMVSLRLFSGSPPQMVCSFVSIFYSNGVHVTDFFYSRMYDFYSSMYAYCNSSPPNSKIYSNGMYILQK